MPLNIAFLFSGNIDSPTNIVLLEAIKRINLKQYQPIVFVENPNGVFTRKLQKNHIPFHKYTGSVINSKTNRLSGFILTFKSSFSSLEIIRSFKIDAILSCEMRFLIPWAPTAYIAKRPLFWLQESIWENYPIARTWAGYTKLIIPVSNQVMASLPPPIQKRATLKIIPSSQELSNDPSCAKKYLESLFKDCI